MLFYILSWKKMDVKNLFKTIICLSVILLASSAVNSFGAAQAVSKEAGDFSLRSIKGDTISLSDFKGEQPVILEFWASWCPSCVSGLKKLRGLYSQLKSDGFEVLTINIRESKGIVLGFASKNNLEFPILLDSDASVAGAYGVQLIPAVFIVDKSGKIKFSGHSIPHDYLKFKE